MDDYGDEVQGDNWINLAASLLMPLCLFASSEFYRRATLKIRDKAIENDFPSESWIYLSICLFLPLVIFIPRLLPLIVCLSLYRLCHGAVLGGVEQKLVDPVSLADQFFAFIENVASIPRKEVDSAIEKYKQRQKLLTKNVEFHADRILLLNELLYSLEKSEGLRVLTLPVSLSYESNGSKRNVELHVIAPKQTDPTKQDFFLCLDNRPLNDLAQLNLSSEEHVMSKRAYHCRLKLKIEQNKAEQRIHLLDSEGPVSKSLLELLEK